MAAALLLEQQRGLDIVGLDAADVVGFLQRTRGSKVSAQRTDLSVGHEVMEVIKKKKYYSSSFLSDCRVNFKQTSEMVR